LKGFNGLNKTQIPLQKVYIGRNPGKEDTQGLVDVYTTDLRKIEYQQLKRK